MERNAKFKKVRYWDRDKGTPADQTEPAKDYNWYSTGAAGILRYRREPCHTTSSATVHPGDWSSSLYPAKCEYCGQDAKSLLDLSLEPEKALAFCCAQRRQLCELMEVDRCVAGGRCATLQAAKMDDPIQLDVDWTYDFVKQSKEMIRKDVSERRPLAPESSLHALSFRLSRAPQNCWTVYSRSQDEQHFISKEDEPSGPSFRHKPLEFGICDYQGCSDFAQKNYSSGSRLLTAFSDGSAQLLYLLLNSYPSGSLAIVVMVTEDSGRVCIVYDDSSSPSESTRAIFHSDGRAMCYHSNRNVWLNLNKSVGRCLERDGSRARQWTWSSIGRVPTVLDPIHLTLNERVKVHVLGQEQVFIFFQACGEEVKFSVGCCS